MYIPGSISSNTNLSTTVMNNNLHQQQLLYDNLKDHRSNKVPSLANFSFDTNLLRELNARYLHDMNTTRSINGTGLPTYLHAKHYHQHTHTHEHNLNILTPSNNSLFSPTSLLPSPSPSFTSINNTKKEKLSSPIKKSNKWCTAHVRISWMIYYQQQRLKDKLSLSNEEQHQSSSLNNKLSDIISNTKLNDSSIPKPSTYQTSILSQPEFNYRSRYDISNVNNTPFDRIPLTSNNAFGGLGSLFSSIPTPIDRKLDINGSIHPLNLDWSHFHHNISSFSSLNGNLSLKKLNEINTNSNNESRKRSSAVLNNDDDHRNSHHHIINNNSLFLNHSRSRSIKSNISDNSKTSSHLFSSTFPNFNPLTFSIMERQRLSTTYATISQGNNSSNLFSNIDSSSMTAALIQREYFLNSLRLSQQQSEQINEREYLLNVNKISKTKGEETSLINNEETKLIKKKISTSPISLSKKAKHMKYEKQSPSSLKEESIQCI